MKTATKKATNHQAVFSTITIPRIGAEWPGEGGVYAGIVRGDDGQPDHHLIVPTIAEAELARGTWKQAMELGKDLSVESHADFSLATKRELALCYTNVPEQFQKEWYWSSTQSASEPSCAWCQLFDHGLQYYDLKVSRLRARAVRRLVIQ